MIDSLPGQAAIGGWAAAVLGVAVGLVLGWLFFGLLRATVDRLATVRNPGALLLASTVARMVLALLTFYGLARWAGWIGLATGLAGFVVARGLRLRGGRP